MPWSGDGLKKPGPDPPSKRNCSTDPSTVSTSSLHTEPRLHTSTTLPVTMSPPLRLFSFVWCLAALASIDAFTLSTGDVPSTMRARKSSSQSRHVRSSTTPTSISSGTALGAIRDLQSLYELNDFVRHDDDLTVVCFHAHWCKTCQKVQHYYKKLDASHPEGVQLANVEYSSHTSLAKTLGVVKLPTMQFYHKGEKLDEFTCGPKTFARVLGTIQGLRDDLDAQQQLVSKLDRGAALVQAAFEQQQQQQHQLEQSLSPPWYGSQPPVTASSSSSSWM